MEIIAGIIAGIIGSIGLGRQHCINPNPIHVYWN